jgi:clan AA aspartic protease (TIGR02281 family)
MIEGKQAQMYFDTGASGVMMSKDQARKFGITVPEDAQDTVANGTSAQLRGKKFPIRSLRMGPIDKRNFDISVIDNFNFALPLLGQSFFGDSNYTIDNDAKVIRFSRH